MLRRIAFGFAMIAVMLASGGCLLRASDSVEPTAIPQLLPSLTPQPTATDTPGPTPEPEVLIITSTPDPNLIPQQTVVAQLGDATIDPIIQEVTLTVAAATQFAIDQTQTAEFDFILPTATFTLDPTFAVVPAATFTPILSTGGGGTGADCEHTVSAGQNLFRIGLQYGVPYQDIAAYNGIANANLITIGQVLVIPGCGSGFSGGSTESGGNLGGSGTVGGSVDPSTGSTCGPELVVDQGDTLFAISLRCNVLIRTIMSLNGISNPDLIYFNQTLRLQ